ncbi:hypothetical protein CCE28_09375 [Anaeromicrobium sediminis]|uniref:Uncharacterized protein n=1 Tax=Anaeromicrobium sediminis TaxID=1478221 RepID=A0A267MKW4_9FIRM|nr:hypothetical protein CCE28_09375 [Anaeromicrobium sediminis]
METFNKITIEEINKKDLLMIIEALDYTGKNTNNQEFIDLKDSMLGQLCSLAETNEEDFLSLLQK